MMKKADKKAWVAALRSGKYKQGRGFLCRDGKYCCLGVAYDVLFDGDWERCSKHIWRPAGSQDEGELIPRSSDYLSRSIERSLGLSLGSQILLSRCNDENRDTLAEIADLIETIDEL